MLGKLGMPARLEPKLCIFALAVSIRGSWKGS